MCLHIDKIKEMENIELIAGNKSNNQNCLCLQCFSKEKQKEKQEIHHHVDINEMSIICPLHGLKTDIPCLDCEKIVARNALINIISGIPKEILIVKK